MNNRLLSALERIASALERMADSDRHEPGCSCEQCFAPVHERAQIELGGSREVH